MKCKKRTFHLNAQNMKGLEPGEKIILSEYCRVLRGRKPLTETVKLRLIRNLGEPASRQRLLLHYLPWVVCRVLDENEPDSLLRRIEIGNRALLGCLRQGIMLPYDDVDYFIEKTINESFARVEQSVPA